MVWGRRRKPTRPEPIQDRRRAERHPAKIAGTLQSESEAQIAMVRDLSTTGTMALTRAATNVGDFVRLSLRLSGGVDRDVFGVVKRFERNEGGSADLWPYKVAVEFDHPLSDVDPILDETEEQALLLVVRK